MIDVEVWNFQSIGHASIRVDGFTALVGRSNIGKSALVRAVKSALTGAGGTAFVRHGPTCARTIRKAKTCECFSTVVVRAKGFDLRWEKGDKINRYTFNGQVYDRAETGTPEFLLRPHLALDFDTVDVARRGKLLQVADQFDNVFLLDQTGSVVADVLSDVARLDRVNTAMRLVEKDRREASSARKVYEKEVTELSAMVAGYDGLDEPVSRVGLIQQKLTGITQRQQQIRNLDSFAQDHTNLSLRVADLEPLAQISVPDTSEILVKYRKCLQLNAFCVKATDKAQAIRALAGVEQVQTPETGQLAELSAKIVRLSTWIQMLRNFKDQFSKVEPVESAKVPDSLSLSEKREALTVLQLLCVKKADLEDRVAQLEQECAKSEAEEAVLIRDRAEQESVLKTELGVLGQCPICEQSYSNPHNHKV